jgi:hypothetical protein
MNRQAQIEAFLYEAHRLAIGKLRAEPQRIEEVRAVLRRWRQQRGHTASDPYFAEWEVLLNQPIDKLEQSVCASTDHAAALRSTSPIAPLLTAQERQALLRSSHQA